MFFSYNSEIKDVIMRTRKRTDRLKNTDFTDKLRYLTIMAEACAIIFIQ